MGSFSAKKMVKKGIVRMRVWVWFVPYLKSPKGLVLCLKEANFRQMFDSKNKFTQKNI